MAQIVTITNPLTGQPAQVDQLDHTAQQIDDGLNIARGVSNPNLLDNWYFGNPVNQRGQTSYTGAVYGIDRWKIQSGSIVLNDNYISLIAPSSSAYAEFRQWYEANDLVGKKATFSVLTDNGLRSTVLTIGTAKYVAFDDCVFYHTTSSGSILYEIRSIVGTTVNLIAAKLELGTEQTLAHQDADGNWVLNEIPDYGEQLARCQRYYRTSFTGEMAPYGAPYFIYASGSPGSQPVVHWDTPMRTNPVVTVYSGNGELNKVRDWISSSNIGITGAVYINSTGFAINGLSSLTSGRPYIFHYTASADL